jgi:hypothetical protein
MMGLQQWSEFVSIQWSAEKEEIKRNTRSFKFILHRTYISLGKVRGIDDQVFHVYKVRIKDRVPLYCLG